MGADQDHIRQGRASRPDDLLVRDAIEQYRLGFCPVSTRKWQHECQTERPGKTGACRSIGVHARQACPRCAGALPPQLSAHIAPRPQNQRFTIVTNQSAPFPHGVDGPVVRVTTPHIPIPSADVLEDLAVPSAEVVADRVRAAMG